MSYRIDRIEKMIEKELALILRDEAKNELLKYVSVTKVTVYGDEKTLENLEADGYCDKYVFQDWLEKVSKNNDKYFYRKRA